MKAAPHINYKALYEQALVGIGQRDKMIALLQDKATQSAKQTQQLSQQVKELNKVISKRDQRINEQDSLITILRQTMSGQDEKITQQAKIITGQNNRIIAQQKELDQFHKELGSLEMIKHELKVLKKLVFGRKSEKHYATTEEPGESKAGDQLVINMEVDTIGTCTIKAVQDIPAHKRTYKKVEDKKRHPGRHEFPADMEQRVTIIDCPDKVEGAIQVGYEDQKQFGCDPVRIFVNVNRRIVYMAPAKEPGTFKQLIAPLPPHPIPKCKAAISVLVMLVIDKFLYHLPTYRQRLRFLQYGIDLKYNTLSNWINRIPEVLEPLYELLVKELIISCYMMMDETRYLVLDNSKKKGKKSHLGFLWAMSNPIQGISAFTYQRGRGTKDINYILSEFKGYLQTDGYGVYTKYGKQKTVMHLQCLAHARRYFSESRNNDLQRSDYALENFFGPLYEIERECKEKGLDFDQIGEKRQKESIPVLNNFKQWLQQELLQVTARTPIHKAITYTLNRFEGLVEYTSDGMLQIDNNFIERLIRPVAVGRKAYMFAGSHRGGERAAIIYSLLGTCKLQGVDPSVWLDDVLRRITNQPKEKLIELLPQNWKPLPKNITATSQTMTA